MGNIINGKPEREGSNNSCSFLGEEFNNLVARGGRGPIILVLERMFCVILTQAN